MRVMGWTLIVAAVVMHFSFCEWGSYYDDRRQVFLFIYCKEVFRISNFEYNTAGAGFWGLVVPVVILGAGVALVRKSGGLQLLADIFAMPKPCPHCRRPISPTSRKCPLCHKAIVWEGASRPARGTPQATSEPAPPAEPTTGKLVPCPDCGRQVSRLAIACPQCGRPLTPARDSGGAQV